MHRRNPLGLVGVYLFVCAPIVLAKGPAAHEEFFEQQVRPLLIDKCQQCHDASIQESDLRLDSRDSVLQGGISGPAAIGGNFRDSLIWQAVTDTGGMERMPPDEPLQDHEIAVLRKWIAIGLPWTAQDAPAPALGDQEAIGQAAESHWAFLPIRANTPPPVPASHFEPSIDADAWQQNPIDAFIASRMIQEGLQPNQSAQRDTLLRRLTYDLVGIPPTVDEAKAFIDDDRSDAAVLEETVDRLLSSKHYGERWARYWLDLARYADTRDWQAQAEIRYPYAYTYRDYVIDSLNEDKAYDQFVREQIAADLLSEQSDDPGLAALGFLTVGPRFRNNKQEQVADKIDVVGRGLMGITISCARCHDHKYDPIPIEDYYSLYGVMASSEIPKSLPIIDGDKTPSEARSDFEKQLVAKQNELSRYKQKLRREAINELRRRLPDYLKGFVALEIDKNKVIRSLKSQLKIEETSQIGLNRVLTDRLKTNTDKEHPVMGPWAVALSGNEKQFAARVGKWVDQWKKDQTLHPGIRKALTRKPLKRRSDLVDAYATVLESVIKKWRSMSAKSKGKENVAALRMDDPNDEAIRSLLFDPGGWFDLNVEVVTNASRLMGKGRKILGDHEKAITDVESTHPGAPPRAMALQDIAKPMNPFVMMRGEPARRGPNVPRQFISILAGPDRKPFKDGSGRRELADAIVDPSNPLTSRVLVNRVWAKYFGKGLVNSLDDFGLRSEPPTHPELLDYLASQLMQNGWSLKWLHKTIVTSQTYAQSSEVRESTLALDPDNRWLSHQNRRRLDFEAMRDSILCAAGTMSREIGGKSVRLSDEPFSTRRSLYAYVDRLELDPILRTFDFASPTASAASRPETTIPQQALFGMNHPFVVQQAEAIAALATSTAQTNQLASSIKQVYRQVFARDPSNEELQIAENFVTLTKTQKAPLGKSRWQYGYGPFGELTANEVSGKFTPFSHWTGAFYQASDLFPDPELRFLRVTQSGAHVGVDQKHSVIRRWIAPSSGEVNVNGTLKHARDKVDGIVAAVRAKGVHQTFSVFNSETKTLVRRIKVSPGDAIDFVASPGPKDNSNSDSHTWTISINGVSGDLEGNQWRSRDDFNAPPPPPISPLGQLAQALLLTNEFLYLD